MKEAQESRERPLILASRPGNYRPRRVVFGPGRDPVSQTPLFELRHTIPAYAG